MTDNNTGSLFHFTKNYSNLKRILKEGFRISYCKEFFGDTFIGIPMISFCDIPLSRTEQHKKDYGTFAIGLDKEKMLANELYKTFLNPVIYCHSNTLDNSLNSYKKEFEDIQTEITRSVMETEYPNVKIDISGNIGATMGKIAKSMQIKHLSNSILGFTKPYGSIKKDRKIIFYNEREWRIVIPEGKCLIDGKLCKWLNEKEYYEWRGDINKPKKLFRASLCVEIEEITFIVVAQETQIPPLIEYIERADSLMEQSVSEKQKRLLISRITSFQRIKKDY